MVVLSRTPLPVGVVLVIHPAAGVLVRQALLRGLLRLAVQADDAVGPELHTGVDEGVEAVVTVLQDVVGAPAHNDAWALVRQVPDHPVLDGPQEVRGGHPAHGSGNAAAQKGVGEAVLAGGELPLFLNELGVKAALQRHLFDQLLVVIGDAQPLGDRLSDGAPAASELTADGDDLLFHGQNLLVMMGGPPAGGVPPLEIPLL